MDLVNIYYMLGFSMLIAGSVFSTVYIIKFYFLIKEEIQHQRTYNKIIKVSDNEESNKYIYIKE